MSHQYKAGDVVTVFQISPANELVIEGKATIRKRVAEVDEQYRVEFANKPGVTYRNSFANGFAVYAEHLRGLFGPDGPMSALPPKADIDERDCHVRFVPKADIASINRDVRYSPEKRTFVRAIQLSTGIAALAARRGNQKHQRQLHTIGDFS
jgi:hypothetical protein